VTIGSVSAHDLFLKLDGYRLEPNARAIIRLFNGTFRESDGLVARERMRDVNVLGPEVDSQVDKISWRDETKTTVMELVTGVPGTYVVGISTKPRGITLKASEFNDYLQHDGVPDIYAMRKKNNQLGQQAHERYSKHARAIFQVGDTLTDDYRRPLNYPVEIIPQQNPYLLRAGQVIEVLCLLETRPLVNQFVMAGFEANGRHSRALHTRTDNKGVARFKLSSAGKWYIKFIHMEPIKLGDFDYESKWASLTFEIPSPH
jgi:Domain of unknown function (DUF4198)